MINKMTRGALLKDFEMLRFARPSSILACLLAGLLIGLGTLEVWALTGDEISIPFAGRKRPSKLQLNIDSRGVDGPGYRPIKITALNTTGPVASERTLRIVLYPNRFDVMTGFDIGVTEYLEIPAGSATASITMLVPQAGYIQQIMMDVYEDGRRLEDVSQTFPISRRQWNRTEEPAILFVDRDVPKIADREQQVRLKKQSAWKGKAEQTIPDFRQIMGVFPNQNNWAAVNAAAQDFSKNRADNIDLLTLVDDETMLALRPLEELPERWLELSCFDLIFINREDLKLLVKEHPTRFKALRDWLAVGSALCVYDLGDDWEHLAELDELLQLPFSLQSQEKGPRPGWELPKAEVFEGNLVQPELRNIYYPPIASGGKNRFNRSKASFVLRDADLGVVVALKEADPFPGAPSDWVAVLNAISPKHWNHGMRNGVSLNSENAHYWDFLIPGVGEAPVISFVFLITCFMIAIGPVNYWLVRRWQRTYLLLITVPIGALIVTFGLFMYALLTEGLQVRGRVRSYTLLDTKHGRATTTSRQSYYASLTPSDGLRFRPEEAVYVIDPHAEEYNRSRFGRQLIWHAESQQLKTNYIYPRTVAQFVATGSQSSAAKLEVKGPRGKEEGRRAINQLGCRIKYLRVYDQGCKPLVAEDIAAGATVDLSATWNDKKFSWQEHFVKNDPQPLVDNPATSNNLLAFVFGGMRNFFNPMKLTNSLLEYKITAAKGEEIPGTFIAVVEIPSEVTKGLKHANETQSFHVIQGDW